MPVADMQKTKVCAATLTVDFKAELDRFRAAVAEQMLEPMRFHGKPLTCALLAGLAPTIAAAMNAQDTLSPRSLFAQMAEQETARVQAAFGEQLRGLEDRQNAARDADRAALQAELSRVERLAQARPLA